jgi:hypothetical protein
MVDSISQACLTENCSVGKFGLPSKSYKMHVFLQNIFLQKKIFSFTVKIELKMFHCTTSNGIVNLVMKMRSTAVHV